MEGQSSAPVSMGRSSSKLRYPLRSATKPKEEKPSTVELTNSSAKRGKTVSSVSKSVGGLDISAKDKSGKPPRRLSIPAKSPISPAPKSAGFITPTAEARGKRTLGSQGKNDTPLSDVSRSSYRRKFSVLSSASYWQSQIKLSESAAKHQISLGFFKLALEAGCEPLQKMRDELKSYVQRHNLAEQGELVKEIFERYIITENLEQQVSETCSQVPGEGTRSSDDDVHSSSSLTGSTRLKPKSLNSDSRIQVSPVIESAKDATSKDKPATRTRGSLTKNSADTISASRTGRTGRNVPKISKKLSKQEPDKGKNQIKREETNSDCKQGAADPLPADEPVQENKENMDAREVEEMTSAEV